MLRTDKQTNIGKNITSLVEVIKGSTQWWRKKQPLTQTSHEIPIFMSVSLQMNVKVDSLCDLLSSSYLHTTLPCEAYCCLMTPGLSNDILCYVDDRTLLCACKSRQTSGHM